MVRELSTRRTMRAAERSGRKLLMLCSTPLSNSEMSLAVIGGADSLLRIATSFIMDEPSPVGCDRRPACAQRVPSKQPARMMNAPARIHANDRLVVFGELPIPKL